MSSPTAPLSAASSRYTPRRRKPVDVDIAATRETAPTAEEGPGRQGSLNRGLSVPGESRGSWGERHSLQRKVNPYICVIQDLK